MANLIRNRGRWASFWAGAEQTNERIGSGCVAQLVERPLPIPEVRSSNPVIGKNLHIEHLFNVNCIEKTKIKEKEAGNGPLKN